MCALNIKTELYFYTGTGNSLWTARELAKELGDPQLIPMTLANNDIIRSDAACIGLIFPVHIWGLPHRVVDFVKRLELNDSQYGFAIAVNAGQVAATLLQLKRIFKEKGIGLSSGFSVCMPSNYIPWGGAPAKEKQKKLFKETRQKIISIADVVKAKKQQAPEKGPLWQNILFSWIYKKSFDRVPEMDKSFRSDEKCNGCGICEKICPVKNISLKDDRPIWQHHCEQCFACLQWCPQEAIQYGKNTTKKKRYHHPEIKLSDMLACIPERSR
jgi:ferredoxin